MNPIALSDSFTNYVSSLPQSFPPLDLRHCIESINPNEPLIKCYCLFVSLVQKRTLSNVSENLLQCCVISINKKHLSTVYCGQKTKLATLVRVWRV